MMLQSIDKNIKLFFYLVVFILLSTQITKNKNTKNNFTIKLKNIIVTGLSDENNYKVYQSLTFLLEKNIFFVSKNDFKEALNKNNLVDNFYIRKIYPNLIKIKIKQTDLLAITSHNSKKYYYEILSENNNTPSAHH